MTADADEALAVRCFLTYSGTKLPLQLSQELDPAALRHRNTYFRAGYDAQGCMRWCEKLVYGEVEMRHDYLWGEAGLLQATLHTPDEEPQVLALPG